MATGRAAEAAEAPSPRGSRGAADSCFACEVLLSESDIGARVKSNRAHTRPCCDNRTKPHETRAWLTPRKRDLAKKSLAVAASPPLPTAISGSTRWPARL